MVIRYASRRPAGEWALPLFLYSYAMRWRGSDISLFPAEGGRERHAVRPAHAPSLSTRARRSGGSRSERRARRSEGSGDRSTRNRGKRNSGCASSRDSLPRRPQSTRRRERKRRKFVFVARSYVVTPSFQALSKSSIRGSMYTHILSPGIQELSTTQICIVVERRCRGVD
jgi:hypothetical protein